MTAPPSRRAPRADRVRNREAILDHGLDVLARDPGASMHDIAAEAGVTRTTVYRHFPTREALIGAIVDRLAAEVRAFVEALVERRLPAEEGLRVLAGNVFGVAERYRLLASLPESSAHARTAFAEDLIAPYLEQRRREGDVRGDLPVPWMATVVRMLCTGAVTEVQAGRLGPEEGERVLADALGSCLLCR